MSSTAKRKVRYEPVPALMGKEATKYVNCTKCERVMVVAGDALGGICWVCCQKMSIPEKFLNEMKAGDETDSPKPKRRAGRPKGSKNKTKLTAHERTVLEDKNMKKLASERKKRKKQQK